MSETRPPRQPHVPPGGADLHARDMTATFAADVTLREAQRRLAEIEQWLPVDGPPEATLGSLVDQDFTGPLRLGYGAWRDLLLGVQFTNGRGELITAGGRTVKNVAGYDLTKFMVGQHGIFGTLVTITTRTYKRPDGAMLVRRSPDDAAALSTIIPTALRPHWSVLTPEGSLCGYLGDETTLAWYETALHSLSPVRRGEGGGEGPSITRRGFDDDVSHRADCWRFFGAGTFRASLPPARIGDAVRNLHGAWAADPAFGVVTGEATDADAASSLRHWAAGRGGTIRFTGVPHTPWFDYSVGPAEQTILRRLKEAFDPDGRLTPLPGVGR